MATKMFKFYAYPILVSANVYREIGWLLSFVYFFGRWQASAVSLPLGDVIFAHLACFLNDVIFVYFSGQCYKTFYGRKLRPFIIRYSVCP
jgi:hypothetical protein